ncbi:MAG: flagellar biosynthesis protein FliQ [Nitrospirota bacterium]|nr:flagellar biosynthesis protein FliQ [Nitrospirota bacterium]
MTPETVINIGRQAMETTLLVSAPILGIGLIVGVAVSLFQAVTQIQEMTLAFIPKILAVMITTLIFFPWMLNVMLTFTASLFMGIPDTVK